MDKFWGIFACAGMMVILSCGCSNDKTVINETVTEITTVDTVTEQPTTEPVTEPCDQYTEKMQMLLKKQESECDELLDKVWIDDEVVFVVPKSGSESSSKGCIEVSKTGVKIRLEIIDKSTEADMGKAAYNYLLNYVEDYYAKNNYSDVEFSGAEDISENASRYVITYLDDSSAKIGVYENTWYLFKLYDEKMLVIDVLVSHGQLDKEGQNIIKALEDYYEISIQCDVEAAAEKVKKVVNKVNFKEFSFELPADWVLDSSMTQTYTVTYISEDYMSCGVTMLQNESYYDISADMLLTSEEQLKSTLRTSGYEVENMKLTKIGDTILGDSIKITYEMNIAGAIQEYIMYCGVRDGKYNMAACFGIGDGFELASKVLNNNIMRFESE